MDPGAARLLDSWFADTRKDPTRIAPRVGVCVPCYRHATHEQRRARLDVALRPVRVLHREQVQARRRVVAPLARCL